MSDEPLRPILFEDLQRMVGHDPVDLAEAERQVNHILSCLVTPMEVMGLMFVEDMKGRSISPDGIPSGHPSVDRTYGNPCARVVLRLMRVESRTDDPNPLGPPQLRTLLRGVDTDGWTLIHSHCDTVINHPLTRPYREIIIFLSKPRSAFDHPKEAADVQ